MIASLINTALTIHCALERTHEFEKIEIGNTELHVKDDCMVEETSIDPHFKILPSTSALKNSTYTIEHEEPKILQILANLDNISLTNNIKHLQMNRELDAQLRHQTDIMLNNTIISRNRINKLDSKTQLSNWHSLFNSTWPIILIAILILINYLYIRHKRLGTHQHHTCSSSTSPQLPEETTTKDRHLNIQGPQMEGSRSFLDEIETELRTILTHLARNEINVGMVKFAQNCVDSVLTKISRK